jgi:hypothetical protein
MHRRLTPARLRELLLAFLPDYLRLAEPDSAVLLDLERIEILPDQDTSRIAATVPARHNPDTVTVLILLRERALLPSEIGTTLARTIADFDLRAVDPILLSVIYLAGGRPGFNLETAPLSRLFGLDLLRIYYTACGLAGLRADYYAERPEPLAWALVPFLCCSDDPVRLRDRCRERIATATGLSETQRALLRRFLDAAR